MLCAFTLLGSTNVLRRISCLRNHKQFLCYFNSDMNTMNFTNLAWRSGHTSSFCKCAQQCILIDNFQWSSTGNESTQRYSHQTSNILVFPVQKKKKKFWFWKDVKINYVHNVYFVAFRHQRQLCEAPHPRTLQFLLVFQLHNL